MVLPRLDRMFIVSTCAGRSVVALVRMAMARSTASAVSGWSDEAIWVSSSRRRSASATSPGLPVIVIRLPRTCTSTCGKPASIAVSTSSRCPSRATMGTCSGTVIWWRTWPAGSWSSVPVGMDSVMGWAGGPGVTPRSAMGTCLDSTERGDLWQGHCSPAAEGVRKQGESHRSGGGGAQHVRAEPHHLSAHLDQPAHLLLGQAALRADHDEHLGCLRRDLGVVDRGAG